MKKALTLFTLLCLRGQSEAQAVRTPELVLQCGHLGHITSIRFSPDGKLAASVGYGELKLWNVSSGELIRTWEGGIEGIADTAFTPDGRSLLIASRAKGISIWDLASARETGSIAAPESCGSVQFSPNGKWVVGASGKIRQLSGRVFIWKWSSRKLWRTLEGEEVTEIHRLNQSAMQNVGVTKDGNHLWLHTEHRLTWWNFATGKKERDIKFEDPTFDSIPPNIPQPASLKQGSRENSQSSIFAERTIATPSPDGKILAVIPEFPPVVQFWDAGAKQKLRESKVESEEFFSPQTATFSSDGRFLLVTASQGNTFLVFDTKTGKQLRQWSAPQDAGELNDTLAFSPDGKHLALGAGESGRLRFTSWPEAKMLTPAAEPPNRIIDYAASTDGVFYLGFKTIVPSRCGT